MDACKKGIIGHQVSDTRYSGTYVFATHLAFEKFRSFPSKTLKFITDGYSDYPLANQQFRQKRKMKICFI